jgi:hypothetical protein
VESRDSESPSFDVLVKIMSVRQCKTGIRKPVFQSIWRKIQSKQLEIEFLSQNHISEFENKSFY